MIEIERKFLVDPSKLPELGIGRIIFAGYFTESPMAIRVTLSDDKCKVCFKHGKGISREEYEYSVPRDDAQRMYALAPYKITKTRYNLNGWEIDKFHDTYTYYDTIENYTNLWIAEIELQDKLADIYLPEWIIREVTDDSNFANVSLAIKEG